MEHFRTPNVFETDSYIVNDTIANEHDLEEQPGLTMANSDWNGHDSYTAMLLHDSPIRNTLDDLNLNAPYNADTSEDLNTSYDEPWLSLSLPQPNVGVSDNTMNVQLNQIPVESNDFDMNLYNNDHLFIQPELRSVDENGMLSGPVDLNEPPPQAVEMEFGGRMTQATAVELIPVAGATHVNRPRPELSSDIVLHSIEDSNLFLQRLITKGVQYALQNDEEGPSVKAGEYLEILLPNGSTDIWERDHLVNQTRDFLCARFDPNQIIVLSSDDEEDEDDEEGDGMDTEDYGFFRDPEVNQGIIEIEADEFGVGIIEGDEFGAGIIEGDEVDEVIDIVAEFDNLSYEEIMAIQDEIGYVDVGVPRERIDEAMCKEQFSATASTSSSRPYCTICRDEYEDGEDIGVLRCAHEFHYECIKEWLTRKNSCPLCRRNAI